MIPTFAAISILIAQPQADLTAEAAAVARGLAAAGHCTAFGYNIVVQPLIDMSETYAAKALQAGWSRDRADTVLAEASLAEMDLLTLPPPNPDASVEELRAIALSMRDQTIAICSELAAAHPDVVPDLAAGNAMAAEILRPIIEAPDD